MPQESPMTTQDLWVDRPWGLRLREALTLGLYVEHFRKPEISASNPLRFGAEI